MKKAYVIGISYPNTHRPPVGEAEVYKAYGKLYQAGFVCSYNVGEDVVVTKEELPETVVETLYRHDCVDVEVEQCLEALGYETMEAPDLR